ncbi:outer membrane protein assembly factor BamE [Roseiarcaceae bacterium H3SJ34-1]|uniref:outer membrane protein assembly factor BamE n=1 Tax=Terripilifer ovatus TaxID=3032367 RepID=UPI003AB94A26|nr:outer membrane protein assembly factor BamE [Roseiarcaceae bacterium H3SJ34-1]
MTKLNIRSKMMGFSLAAALATSLGGCMGYDGDVYRGYVIDDKTMSQIKMGSSAEQTLVVLGTPSTTSTVGGDAWYYISQKTERKLAFMQPTITDQRIFAVYFDKNKKVQRIANYGLEDGKVINFLDRTTPTAGGETSFLKNMMQNLLRFS